MGANASTDVCLCQKRTQPQTIALNGEDPASPKTLLTSPSPDMSVDADIKAISSARDSRCSGKPAAPESSEQHLLPDRQEPEERQPGADEAVQEPDPEQLVTAEPEEEAPGAVDRTESAKPRAKRRPSKGCGCMAIGRTAKKQAMSKELKTKLEELFGMLDKDGSRDVTREEALSHWRNSFGNISVDAFFNEVDSDMNGVIDLKEFLSFWQQVKDSGYSEEAILEEVEELRSGQAWVDWKDQRQTLPGASNGKH